MFDLLVKIGFKEIELAFPSASQTEFDFCRALIETGRLPADVWPQVMTPAREPLIRRTFDAMAGAKQAIIHLYNATAPVFRDLVFGMSRAEVVELAAGSARLCRQLADERPETEWRLLYSPETFCFTEMDFALEVCEAVKDAWKPCAAHPMILNLPTTVEVATPNVFADQIEWFIGHIGDRDSVIVSIHPHNDRGTGVASAELALMAGAQRVEGTLFGNGERTGNVDLVTLALNLYSQGIWPGLDFSDLRELARMVEDCIGMPVGARSPYAGELVFTAFSGSHQDAIRKGFAAHDPNGRWRVPYLPVDPADLGRSYEAVIRVNSQSGKGGIAWILEQSFGLRLPRPLQVDFAAHVQRVADARAGELSEAAVWRTFRDTYHLDSCHLTLHEAGDGWARVSLDGVEHHIIGQGNGPLAAFVAALRDGLGIILEITDYSEHAIGHGAEAQAAAYVQCRGAEGSNVFGVGISPSIVTASLLAVVSAACGLTA